MSLGHLMSIEFATVDTSVIAYLLTAATIAESFLKLFLKSAIMVLK